MEVRQLEMTGMSQSIYRLFRIIFVDAMQESEAEINFRTLIIWR